MPDEQVLTQTAPVVEQAAPVISQEPDLLTKVNQFRTQRQQSQPQVPAEGQDIGFDYKELESIKDPVAKEIAMKAYKSMQSGVTKKFQEIATTKKEYELKVAEMQNWTPQRIQQELLNNPQFLQAAQQVAGSIPNPQNSGLTDEQFSALTDKEKAEITALKSTVNELKAINYQALISSTDSKLQLKYGDAYNPNAIDNSLKQLASMQPHELREYIYKATNHERDVEDAYELGRQEALQRNQDKLNSFSLQGNQTTNNDGMPVRQKSDNDQTWFTKLAQFRLSQSRKR